MSRIDEAGDDVADRAETDADALEALEREERMIERTWGPSRKVAASVLRGVAESFRTGTPPAGTPVVRMTEAEAEAKLARRAENKRLVEKARELLGLAISLDTALETETSRKLFNTARVILRNLDVAP